MLVDAKKDVMVGATKGATTIDTHSKNSTEGGLQSIPRDSLIIGIIEDFGTLKLHSSPSKNTESSLKPLKTVFTNDKNNNVESKAQVKVHRYDIGQIRSSENDISKFTKKKITEQKT